MRIALIWQDERGATRSYTLRPEKEYFIGRLSRQDQERLGTYDNGQVYIWSTDYTEHVPTGMPTRYAPPGADKGIKLMIISRRHAKLYYRDSSWHIKDHGPNGTGSTNGTLINSTRLPRGAEHPIRPGDKIKLSPLGSVIIVGEAEKETVRITLRAADELPSSLAENLSRRGLVEEVSQVPGGNAITVLRRQQKPTSIELPGGIKVEIQAAGSDTYKREKRRAKINELVLRLSGFTKSIEYYKRGNMSESIMQDEGMSLYGYLASRNMRDLIHSLGDEEAAKLYEELIEMLGIIGNDMAMADIDSLRRKIIIFKSILETYL